MSRFITLHCGEETKELLRQHPNAFLLLTQIAMRAKWKDCPIMKLKAGQAFIGDWREAGLHSEMAYRHAKDILTDCKLATFQGTNRGTVATLTDTRIFSISTPATTNRETPRQHPSNEPTTTNHTDTQNTQTPFALDGTSSGPPQKISWNLESGFSGITDKDHAEWKEAFPAVNVSQQLAAASRWLKDNPAKRKKQIGRFLTNWFSRNQEQGGSVPSNPHCSSSPVQDGGVVGPGGRIYK